ncbi:dTMP kinase [archaeon]|jgi:dTMP kinase|nr:dTMP kinase [archaeon]MBT4022720.1 dTMP kinase [archaeon]MBT4273086.1 dTMP kinase [archaeon]MBT4461067.1 dTMP kinase [archaeon]MBT4858736.1 dTMP kinase [archaeon]
MTYIILEGVVGTGKTTQADRLFEHLKKKYPNKEVILTREPGGTEIAEAIRKLVQGTDFEEEMVPTCEAYLYASARAQSLRKIVKPVLDKGGIVIADRSFLSSIAYQGYAKNLGMDKVFEINKTATKGFEPDIILFLKLDPKIGLSRTFDQGGDKHEKESVEFFEKIEQGYIELSKMYLDIWKMIDAKGSQDDVFDRIKNAVKDL